MRRMWMPALGGALVGVGLLGLTAVPSFAQETPTTPTHEQMDRAMDAEGGEGTSQRMHEAMGGGDAARGEQLMDQCVGMMGMMQNMQGMMGMMNGGGMSGMMGGGSMPGMTEGTPTTDEP